jgi:uncharacterized protein (TIGR00369 family)
MTWATDRLEALKAGAPLPPVVSTLGMGGLEDWGEGWVKKRWEPKPELLNGDGSLFGGYIAALADQALAFAAMTVLPADRVFRTVGLHVQFLRLGRAHPLLIEARIVAQTRQLITCRAEFRREDGDLVAEATGQQLVIAAV